MVGRPDDPGAECAENRSARPVVIRNKQGKRCELDGRLRQVTSATEQRPANHADVPPIFRPAGFSAGC